jgi:hypothetical protein
MELADLRQLVDHALGKADDMLDRAQEDVGEHITAVLSIIPRPVSYVFHGSDEEFPGELIGQAVTTWGHVWPIVMDEIGQARILEGDVAQLVWPGHAHLRIVGEGGRS